MDYVNIQYVDMQGETHEEWLIDGCISNKENFEGVKRKSRELCKLFDKTHPLKYWEQLFDKCFELSERR